MVQATGPPFMIYKQLGAVEKWWQGHEPWLTSLGYQLGPRYRQGWIFPEGEADRYSDLGWVISAIGPDGSDVALKRIKTSVHPFEVDIMQLLNSDLLVSHPDNPCVPLLAVLTPPQAMEYQIVVMPFLRDADTPPFETVGEIAELCRQALHGLRFLHANNIAHRDPHFGNIMLDPRNMYPHGFHTGFGGYNDMTPDLSGHAKCFTRTQRPSRYYWIDYGISRTYSSVRPVYEPYIRGGDKEIPETRNEQTHADPFASDVWWIGNLIQRNLMDRYSGLSFLQPLVNAMRQERPEDRPTMDDVVKTFDALLVRFRWRLPLMTIRKKHLFAHFLGGVAPYVYHTIGYLCSGRRALPSP